MAPSRWQTPVASLTSAEPETARWRLWRLPEAWRAQHRHFVAPSRSQNRSVFTIPVSRPTAPLSREMVRKRKCEFRPTLPRFNVSSARMKRASMIFSFFFFCFHASRLDVDFVEEAFLRNVKLHELWTDYSTNFSTSLQVPLVKRKRIAIPNRSEFRIINLYRTFQEHFERSSISPSSSVIKI